MSLAKPGLLVELEQEAGDWPAAIDWPAKAERVFALAVEKSGLTLRKQAHVSVVLSDDAGVKTLNAQWRGLDKPTNVLSFQAVEAKDIARAPALGDIVLACETVRAEAEAEGKSFENHATHLLTHGFLHLLGYDHDTDSAAERMEALEREVLSALGIADPYADSDAMETERR